MRGRQILLDRIGACEAAALMVDGRLDDFLLDAPDRPRPGTVLRAVCDRPMGAGGMILRLPDGTAFLRQGGRRAAGDAVLVQVTGYGEGGKATPVTDRLSFRGRFAVVTPGAPGLNISRRIADSAERTRLREIAEAAAPPEFGLILRSAAAGADADVIAAEIAALADRARRILSDPGTEPALLCPGAGPHDLARSEWDGAEERGGFAAAGVLDALEDLRVSTVRLDPGTMSVEPTRALVAIDIDTGGDTSPAAGLKVNRAAMLALPRALRLRGLGGQIVIDPAPTGKARRPQIEEALRRALAADPVDTALAGWTPLGHLELQRKRDRLPVVPRLPEVL